MKSKPDLIDKAVHELNGVLPDFKNEKYAMAKDALYMPFVKESFICNREQFEHRASELGYVNGYRWGVEYELDGKGPDLPDDTLIVWTDSVRSAETTCHGMNWVGVESFKITDQRYKPADTSYLDSVSEYTENNHEISAGLTGAECMDLAEEMFWQFDNLVSKTPENQRILFKQFLGAYHKRLVFAQNQRANDFLATDWYCYETQKALRLPPVGTECEWKPHEPCKADWKKCVIDYIHGEWVCVTNSNSHKMKQILNNVKFRPLDWNRKAEAERKRVVDAALEFFHETAEFNVSESFNKLYDAGYLRLPADKS